MHRKKALKLTGFAGTLCATAALVGLSVSGTGAYFQDHADGSINGSSGHLKLIIDPGTSTNLSFSDLMPGDNVDRTIHYATDVSSGGVDVWMVFDPNSVGYQAFTGAKGSTSVPDGGLGRYGYFKVADSRGGTAFRTGNLSFAPGSNNTPQPADCPTDANGRGGSDWIATASDPNATQYCGVPSAILLASNLQSGQDGNVTVTFGLNGYKQTQQNQSNDPSVGFQLVATQHGQRPTG